MDILGYFKNTDKNRKFGKVRQVPTREFPTKFPDWDLSHSSKFGIFVSILQIPGKISKNGNPLFFPVVLYHAHDSEKLVKSVLSYAQYCTVDK